MQKIGVQLTEVFAAAGLTDVGQRREKNEDSYLLRPEHGILIVADGLGGRPAGEVASRLGCETALESLLHDPSSSALTDRMALAVTSANQVIWDASQADPDTAGMGTTVTSLLIDLEAGQLGIGHVGDSRAYRFRDRELERLTTDHTLVQELLEAGAIKPSDAEKHPLGYLLNRAVGTEPEVKPQIITQPTLAGDLFLLCTDGLLAVISEEEIACAVREGLAGGEEFHSAALQSIAERLVSEANDGGAPDNVTVGLLGILR
jgi:PPM family protein phosphatase